MPVIVFGICTITHLHDIIISPRNAAERAQNSYSSPWVDRETESCKIMTINSLFSNTFNEMLKPFSVS